MPTKKTIRESDVRKAARELVRELGSIRPAARKLRVSSSYLHDLVRGRRRAGPNVLRRLGFRRVVEERLERLG